MGLPSQKRNLNHRSACFPPGSPHSKKRTPPGTHGSTQIFSCSYRSNSTRPFREKPLCEGQVHPTARSELLLALMGQRKSSPCSTEVTHQPKTGNPFPPARFTPQQEANSSWHSLVNANLLPARAEVTPPSHFGKGRASPRLALVRGTRNAERPLLSRTFNHLQP